LAPPHQADDDAITVDVLELGRLNRMQQNALWPPWQDDPNVPFIVHERRSRL
jgi:hypothetical protein